MQQDCRFEVKAVESDGTFEGLGAVFNNVDGGGDMIVPGAFEKTLREHRGRNSLPALLWQHDWHQPIGVYREMAETSEGLHVVGQLALTTQQGKEAHELMKMKALDGLSIGYQIKAREMIDDPEPGEPYRILKEIDLWEVSPVTFPMNPDARVTRVKAKLGSGEELTARDLELFLRDAGFSRKESKAVVANGYEGLRCLRDAGAKSDEVITEIQKLIQLLRV